MSDIAIKFENVSKMYRLGLVGTGTLSHDIRRWWITSVRGKEDPYLKIGETNDRASKGQSDYVYALKDIDFEVHQGDVLGIIGKNGAGKSTLLKLLSRVTYPTTGKIYTKGRIASLLEVGTGFHPELTGRENIYMNGSILGMKKWEIDKQLDAIVDFSGCERYLDTPTKRYSSGMTVRLGFAIAAHLNPEILVVDEVLAVGDAEFQKKAIGKMQDVSRGEGRTVLFVSHNMASVRRLCKTGILLQNGQLAFSGTMNETIDKYLSVFNFGEKRSCASYPEDATKTHQILETRLETAGHELIENAIDVDGEINLYVRYKFNIEITQLHLVFIIKNSHDEIVWVNDRSDYYSQYAHVVPGVYESEIRIPNPLLAPGTYTISLGCVDKKSNINDSRPHALAFEISDSKAFRQAQRLSNIFYPIEWPLNKKD